MPRQTSVNLTPATERQIAALRAQGYGTTTDVIRIAIDRMAQQEGHQTMKVTNRHGVEIDFDAAVSLMDDRIREAVHADYAPCSNQKFFDVYAEKHDTVMGETWELDKPNPIW